MSAKQSDLTSQIKNWTFNYFKDKAKDISLTLEEKMGFSKEHRLGKDSLFLDFFLKVIPNLNNNKIAVLDIGSGCGELVTLLYNYLLETRSTLTLIDSEEMLSNISLKIEKVAGRFPQELSTFISENQNKYDVIIINSVLQHVWLDSNPFSFIEEALTLLKKEGYLLLGDIPNYSKAQRYFKLQENLPQERIDDSILLSIVSRLRSKGYESYLIPHSKDLPLKDRRENILVYKH